MDKVRLIDKVNVLVNGEGSEAILMIHGWPDTPIVWEHQVQFFKNEYRCIRLTLPSYEGPSAREIFTIEQIVMLIKDVIEQYGIQNKAILMIHDWGASFGYQFYIRHPEMVSKIIGVDIGDFQTFKETASIKTKLMVSSYQLYNVFSWYLGRFGGDTLTQLIARFFGAPAEADTIYSNMNWPYYMQSFAGEDSYKNTFEVFNPTCPFLFIYGTEKPVMFHDQEWADRLGSIKVNSAIGFECDHWVMIRDANRFNESVNQWLLSHEKPI